MLQHYLQPERLEELGLHSADAWAATFVEFQTAVEVTPDGSGFRMKRRPAKFENVPELLTLFGEVADLRPPGVVRRAAAGRPPSHRGDPGLAGAARLRRRLAERADHLREVDPRDDNMLKICSDGRKAALDLELVGITPAAPQQGRRGRRATSPASTTRPATWSCPATSPARRDGGFQIVFCDLGTPDPASGSQVYGKIRGGLVAAGVPAGRIRFIHDAVTDLQKAALFADCRSGKVAVLLGSTDKLGVGTNIQTRCVALHHVDAPWRPADVEQREGRALRPGNLNPTVEIFRYVTERSFDSFLWQSAGKRKSRFIGQVLSGRPTGRDVDDLGDATLSYAEVKALATGNPLLLELAEANCAGDPAAATRRRAHPRGPPAGRFGPGLGTADQRQDPGSRRPATGSLPSPAQHPDRGLARPPGAPIPGDDVAGHLAQLVGQALSSGRLPGVSWRGLRISFATERSGGRSSAVATISAGLARA